MESYTDIITLRDTETTVWGDHAEGNNVTAVPNSSSSTAKIKSLFITLGIVKEKDNPPKCSHFSIRGYVAKMCERDGNNHLPFADVSGEDLPPIQVPHFRYWLCQSCLQDYSQEAALVSEYGKSMMSILPSGEGTSGLKPVDERINGDESILAATQEDTTQSSPYNILPPKIDSIETNHNADATVVGDFKKVGIASASLTESDQQNQDPINGHPHRKARKERLLTELLCTEKQHHQRKESTNLPDDSSPTPSSPLKKRRRPIDVSSQVHIGKKVKVVKGAGEGDKYQCKKHGTERSSKLKGNKPTCDPVAAWRLIFSDMDRSDKIVPVANESLIPSHDDVSEKSFNASKKVIMEINPMRNQLYGEDDLQQRTNVCDSDPRLGLGLSLNYKPPLPNRAPPNTRKDDGFFFGEPSIGHKGISHEKRKSVYNVRDGYAPRTPFLREHQQPFHSHLSHGSFSQHQNLDFSDPHNKRNTGVRGYSDVNMKAHNHQNHDIFSNGRSDEREIVELMAKIQYERNLGESRDYSISSNFHRVTSFNTLSHYHESRESNRIPDAQTNIQMMEDFKNGIPGNMWSNMETHTKWSNRNKVMNLDLNAMAPNVVEDQNNTSRLDRSYSNEAIPAMQLLSLMDAVKKSTLMAKKSLTTPKPFSCYNGVTEEENSTPSSEMQSSVQTPVENSRNFVLGHGASSHSSPLPWHTSEGSLGLRNVTFETEICTINQNPADFSSPGPENLYMIDAACF